MNILIMLLLIMHPADTIDISTRKDSLVMTAPDSSLTAPFPRVIPDYLDPQWFIPKDRLLGYEPWTYAPLQRPVFPVLTIFGFDDIVGFGQYAIQHPEKFFSTFLGYNSIDVPQLYVSEQMMIGNTLKLGRKVYFLSGIIYGSHLGVHANSLGAGTRDGFIISPSSLVSIVFWTQYYQSLDIYFPVLFPRPDGNGAAITMPASPEVFSFGMQASFTVGEFIIGVGTSVTPRPLRYR